MLTSPPEEPPELWRVSYGFNVRPVTKFDDSQLVQNSGVLETKSGIPPADLRSATVSPSSVAFIPFLCTDPTEYEYPVGNENKQIIEKIYCKRILVHRNHRLPAFASKRFGQITSITISSSVTQYIYI